MSWLSDEIHQQSAVIARMLEAETENVRDLCGELRGRFSYIVIAARGSSDNAARYAKYSFGAHNQLQIALATPSLFTLYHKPPSLVDALVVGISQSGRSPDIVSVVAEAKRQGQPTLAIVNDTSSPLANTADFVIPVHAGQEMAIAATKTYTCSLAALALLSTTLARDEERYGQLERLPAMMEATLSSVGPEIRRCARYRSIEHCAVIGRGYNYATAFEIALKVKELAHVIAEPYSSADFRHGPIAMIGAGFPVISIAPGGAVGEDLQALIVQLKALKAQQLIISDSEAILQYADLPLPLPPGVPEWLSPMVAVLPGQLLGLSLAEMRGLDPDRPTGLKKVTETL